ncbi:MAG: site-specific integrase, partial [Eubacteriales bacterium]
MQADKALDFFVAYQKARNFSELTISAYQTDLIQFLEFAGHETGTDFEKMDVENTDYFIVRSYIGFLIQKELKRKSIARKLAAIRSFFKYLCREGYLTDNPVQKVSTPKQGKTLPRFLFEEHMNKLLGAPDSATIKGIRDQVILEFLYGSGLRVSELVSLNIMDV